MGTSSSKSIAELSKEDVAAVVSSLGAKYGDYSRRILENGVDGSFLAGLSVVEIRETLDDLDVGNRLHRRVLSKLWQKSMNKTKSLHKVIGRRQFYSRTYNYDRSTSSAELSQFDSITEGVFDTYPDATLNAISLMVEDGQLSLTMRTREENGAVSMERSYAGKDKSVCCQCLSDGSNKDFYLLEVPHHIRKPPQSDSGELRFLYSAFVIRNKQGDRIGMVCMVEKTTRDKIIQATRESFLRQLAENAAFQLELRRALVKRHSSLEQQFSELRSKESDPVLLQGNESVAAVRRSQVERRLSGNTTFHYPSPLEEDSKLGRTGFSMKNSKELPVMKEMHASREQMKHLPDGFFDPADQMGVPRPPIGKTDMDRCATTDAMDLKSLQPGSEIALEIKKHVKMLHQMFDFPHVALAFQEPMLQTSVCAIDADEAIKQCFQSFTLDTVYENGNSTPFMMKYPRLLSPCMYTMAASSTFVIHDMAEDEVTKKFVAMGMPFRSFVGCPLRAPNGHLIAIFCMIDKVPRPDFRAAHEIQMEQISSLMMHSIENWVLRRDIKRLETERKTLISRHNDKAKPPQGRATIVVTDIQGSTAMWEENPEIMQEAQDIHDSIIRRVCAQYFGYEIDTEGDSFHLAFHGPLDALSFALQAQVSLFQASWSKELLEMSNAEPDSSSFRGVRVRMGIHHGQVATKSNQVTGRTMYEGKTYQLAKSLEVMSHGGQIIASSTTWNLVKHFSESTLGSPQVVDLGHHIVKINARSFQEGVTRHRIIQLVPRDLSYDYCGHRSSQKKSVPELTSPSPPESGRQFHPTKSVKYLSCSFHDAPYLDSRVTLAFVNVSEMAECGNDKKKENMLRTKLVQLIESLIERLKIGYLCSGDELLAFNDQNEGICFGLILKETLSHMDVAENGKKLSETIRYGSVHRTFSSMGPEKTSGKAVYHGIIANEAMEFGSMVDPGYICCAVFNGRESLHDLGGDIRCRFVRMGLLQGGTEVSCYECDWRVTHGLLL